MTPFINSYQVLIDGGCNNIYLFLIKSVLMLLTVPILLKLQTILHEIGHLIFGLVTGYRLVAFRINSTAFVNQSGKWVIRKYKCRGSAGQCIMVPTDKVNNRWVLHILGGVIVNAVISLIAFNVALSSFPIDFILRLELLTLAIYDLLLIIINGIPLSFLSIVNDGSAILEIRKSPTAFRCYYNQLIITHKLIQGISYKDLPYELFHIPEGEDLSNTLIAYHKILESYFFMDLGQWDKAKHIIDELKSVKNCRTINETLLLEQCFISIMTNDNRLDLKGIFERIKPLLNNELDINIYRVQIAYELSHDPSDIEWSNIDKLLQKYSENYLFQGDVTFCKAQIIKLINSYL